MKLLLMLASALVAILSAIVMNRIGYKRFIAWELLFSIPLFVGGILLGSIGIITDKSSLIHLSIGSFLGSGMLLSIPSIKTYQHRNDIKEYQRPSVSSGELGQVIDFPQKGDGDSSS